MALRSFIAIFALLSVLFLRATPSEPPPAPSIAVSPPKAQFLIGDAVSIACSAPPEAPPVSSFRFSGASWRWVTDVRSTRRTFVLTFNVTGPGDGGAHRCSYSAGAPGRVPAQSQESRAVVIHVRDRPSHPTLTVSPSSVTIEGQPLLFLCVAPPGDAERRFRFFQEDLEVTDGVPESSGSTGVRLRLDRSGRNLTGNFSCHYEEMTEGRWIASYPSGAIPVVVKGPSPPPLLSVDPPSGVVAVGHQLRLTCAAPRDDFRRRFRFFRDGAEVTSGSGGTGGIIGDISGTTGNTTGDTGDTTGDIRDTTGDTTGDIGKTIGDTLGDIGDTTGDGSELLFPRVSREFSGIFSCHVEEEVGGAWLEAPPSQGVAVVVRAPPPPPILLLSTPSATLDSSEPQISLTCLIPAPSGPARRRFRFFHHGIQSLAGPTTSPRAQISVPAAPTATAGAGHGIGHGTGHAAGAGHGAGHGAGAFTCQYEEEVGTGWALSPPSAAVTVPSPAQPKLLPLVVGVTVGVVALLLGLLLAAWLCRRRRGGSHWRGLHPGDDAGTFAMADVEVAA